MSTMTESVNLGDCSDQCMMLTFRKKTNMIVLKVKSPSHVQLFVTPWTVAYHAPLSMGFSRQEYWSGLPLPSPRYQRQHKHSL